MTDELTDYVLPRTGRPPLAFEGECLAWVDGEEYLPERRPNPRWHDLALYRTRSGRFVLSVNYRTTWGQEAGHDEAAVLEGPQDVGAYLRALDPTLPVKGYPEGPTFAKKQERLLDDLRKRWDRAVSALFEQLGPEFAERVD